MKIFFRVICTLTFLVIQISSALTQETITNGLQVWMTKNLNEDKFRNGDHIPQATSIEEWKSAGENKQPAWCYYDNDPANGAKYGKLYNWYAVNDPRGLAPKGYHIPSGEELLKLNEYLGEDAGAKQKAPLGGMLTVRTVPVSMECREVKEGLMVDLNRLVNGEDGGVLLRILQPHWRQERILGLHRLFLHRRILWTEGGQFVASGIEPRLRSANKAWNDVVCQSGVRS